MLHVILYFVIGLLLIPITAFLLKHKILIVNLETSTDVSDFMALVFLIWPIVFFVFILMTIFTYIGNKLTNYINGE